MIGFNIKDIRAFIFDYGGTLDTGGCHWGKMLWHAYEQTSVPVSEERFRDAYIYAERMLGSRPLIHKDFNFRQTLDIKIRLEMEYLDCISYHNAVLDLLYSQVQQHTNHSIQVLQQMKDRYPMVLVSNFYGNMTTVLQEFGFDGIFCQLIESAVVGVRKPDPKIFELGVKALGFDTKDIVVVGDSMEKDIIPAKNIGCRTIWLRGEQWKDTPIDETIPDRIINDINEIIQN